MTATGRIMCQDDSCHWYLVPLKKKPRFDELLEGDDGNAFDDEFYKYRIDCPESVIVEKWRRAR